MAQAQQNVTLADVARLAGVGVGTASRALSGSPKVAAATRQKVLDVAESLHYVVSPDAAGLARGTTGRVALVVPHLSRWFFGAVTEGIDSVLRGAELDVLLYHVGDLRDRQDFFERLPARRKVDAVVVVAFPVEELERKRLELMGVQVVAAGGQSVGYPSVRIDDYVAARQAVDHLLFLGHRRIGMLEARDPDQPTLVPPRSRAFHEALAERGITVDSSLVVTSDWGGEQGAQAMAQLISLPDPPTAVFAHSDEVALGAMRTIRRATPRSPCPPSSSSAPAPHRPHAEPTHLLPLEDSGYDALASVLAPGRGARTCAILVGSCSRTATTLAHLRDVRSPGPRGGAGLLR